MDQSRTYTEFLQPQENAAEKLSDQLVWSSFQEGGNTAFQYIYDQNFDALLNYGLKICRDQKLAEDQIQELFIYLWQKKENINIKTTISIYLHWALRNRIIKCLKSDKGIKLSEDSDFADEIIDDNQIERVEQVENGLDSLPSKQREAIHLKFFQNLSGDEIAKIMGITIGTVYNLLSRAMTNLKASCNNK